MNNEKIVKELFDLFKIEKPQFKTYIPEEYIQEIETTGEDEEWKEIKGFNYSVSNYVWTSNMEWSTWC